MTFGQFVRELRARKRITLREFCLKNNHDPSNWSKMEREELPPPENPNMLEDWALELGIEKGSTDWYLFFDLAAQGRGKIPPDLLNDVELVDALPMFFRTFRGQKPSEEELDKTIQLLRKR